MQWANETTRQAQSNPPWPPGTIVTPEVLAQYADWKQVPDDYELPVDPAQVRAAALAKIDADTRAAIIGGFVSSASGSAHTYDSDDNDQDNLKLMQAVAHSPRFAAHPVYQGRIPIRAIPAGQTEKTILYLDVDQMDLLLEDLALHIGACKMAGWAAQAEVE